jgi:hypothetical protein
MTFSSRKSTLILLPLLCVFVLAACSTRTPVQQVSIDDVSQKLKYKNILFGKFVESPNVQANVPTVEPLRQCKSTAISYLSGKNIFNRVEDTKGGQGSQKDGPTLIVEGDLTYLKIVAGAARFWGGAFAGRSAMKINVKLTDASTGTVVTQQELVGAPSAMSGAWSGGGSDSALPAKMGYLLGDFILANVGD